MKACTIVKKTLYHIRRIETRFKNWILKYVLPVSYLWISLTTAQKLNKKKKLLIVRIDAIGDFVLFSPFLSFYRKLFKDYKITLLVNTVNASFAERYLKDGTIDNIMTFNRGKSGSFVYMRNLLQSIKNEGFTIAIYPTYSREAAGDYIIVSSEAYTRIGCDGDYRNISYANRQKTDAFYTHLVPASEETLIEPERNKEFIVGLANQLGLPLQIGAYLPALTPNSIETQEAQTLLGSEGYDPTKKYMIVCPGSSDPKRNWQIEKFAQVITDIHNIYHIEIILCGSRQEMPDINTLKSLINFHTIDLTGKTSLSVFAAVCTKAIMYLGNDTGTTHIASAVGLPIVCIMGGGINRFFPYGDSATHVAVYDENKYAETAHESRLRYKTMYGTEKNVTEAQVLTATRKILDQIL